MATRADGTVSISFLRQDEPRPHAVRVTRHTESYLTAFYGSGQKRIVRSTPLGRLRAPTSPHEPIWFAKRL